MRLERDAWAKVNLTLRVTGRTAEGYHLLQSLVVFAALGDRVTLEAASGLAPDETSLEITGPFAPALLPQGESTHPPNLVLKAVDALRQATGTRAGLRVTLEKNLPVAAGLGGGSADAAATLLGLRDLWGLKLPDEALRRLALPLGADLPVCLLGVPCLVGGIGEELAPLARFPEAWLVLANPGAPVSTAAVFESFAGDFGRDEALQAPRDLTDLARWLRCSGNDLEAAARRVCPAIGEVLRALAASEDCLLARMSGSGGTCYGLFAEGEAALGAARRLSEVESGWWVKAAPVRQV